MGVAGHAPLLEQQARYHNHNGAEHTDQSDNQQIQIEPLLVICEMGKSFKLIKAEIQIRGAHLSQGFS